jgi:hypothetical protein
VGHRSVASLNNPWIPYLLGSNSLCSNKILTLYKYMVLHKREDYPLTLMLRGGDVTSPTFGARAPATVSHQHHRCSGIHTRSTLLYHLRTNA